MPVLCTFACMCVERDFKSLSTTLFNCLFYCYNKFLPTRYLKNLICFATFWFLWSSTWVFAQESPRSEAWSFRPCPVTLVLSVISKDLRIKRAELMSTDTAYRSHSGVKDPEALQVAPLHPPKPSPSKSKTEPSNISLQSSYHTLTVILRPSPIKCFPCGSAGKESACNVGDLGSIPGFGRSPGEGRGCPLQYSGLANCIDCVFYGVAKSRTQLSDFPFPIKYFGLWSCMGCCWSRVHCTHQPGRSHSWLGSLRVAQKYFEIIEIMETHSSILAWRIPWTEESGRLQSMGLHRVRHNWSNLACMQILSS